MMKRLPPSPAGTAPKRLSCVRQKLSQDHTPDLPVFQHALHWLAEHEGYQPEIVVQLRPTSPFRRVWHIDQAVYQLAGTARMPMRCARSVCPFQNPFKMWRIDPDGLMRPLIDTEYREALQHAAPALPEVYWQTGYVDAAWTDTILEKNSMTGDRILPLVIDPPAIGSISTRPTTGAGPSACLESGEITFEDLGFRILRLRYPVDFCGGSEWQMHRMPTSPITIKIGDRLVGDGQPTYIIAEIGVNHNGFLDLALKLIDVAVGCWRGCGQIPKTQSGKAVRQKIPG